MYTVLINLLRGQCVQYIEHLQGPGDEHYLELVVILLRVVYIYVIYIHKQVSVTYYMYVYA